MSSTDYFATEDIQILRQRIDEITDQLCVAVAGDFDFNVRSTVADETLDRLAMLINFLIEAARRSLVSLQAQNSSLAELDKLKSDFVANISHELRTPLTLILAPLRSILAEQYGPVPRPIAQVAERVLRNTVRLNGLVNDLLDVSKLEAGKMRANPEAVDLSAVLKGLVTDLEPAAREREIKISLSIATWPRNRYALLDQKMFERIAINLLSNAFKFTPKNGAVAVSLSLEKQTIVLRVLDTGIGISSDMQPLLFHRFQQVDSSANRAHPGTGLGLALVKEFAELMNGEVSLESELGAGAIFTVRLPFVEVTDEASIHETQVLTKSVGELLRIESQRPFFLESSQTTSASRNSSPQPPLLRRTILVVEDNLDLQAYVQETLSDEFRVVCAGNGHEAIAILNQSTPDVILSDVMMPGMDGLELLRRVKAHASWKFVPVILLSARVTREERIEGLEVGADDYLTKPFDAFELKTRLRAALRTRALYQELEHKNHELEEARADLKRKVEDRTYELSLQSQKAMAANKAKDHFLANMSHEMRTPLTAIMGFSDLISSGVDAADGDEFIQTIRRNAKHLLSLIDEILDFSKIESGQVSIERDELEIRDLITQIVQSFKPQVDQKAISLQLKLADDLPCRIVSDQKRVRQMITNLVGNAVKFTESGSVRIEANVIDDRGAPQLRIRVIDTGIGISKESHSRLFAPFAQADTSLSRKFGGTGLGLALSRKIARSLGGELIIEASEPGVGSTFTLWFPVQIVNRPNLKKMASKLQSLGKQGKELTGLHILLAEDSIDNRRLLKRLLEGAGARLDFAVDGLAAVDMAQQQDFDVILMDIQMPRLDGFSATRQIRGNGFKKPILALTAHASEQDLAKVLEAGCNDRLLKPIEFDQMVSRILANTTLDSKPAQLDL